MDTIQQPKKGKYNHIHMYGVLDQLYKKPPFKLHHFNLAGIFLLVWLIYVLLMVAPVFVAAHIKCDAQGTLVLLNGHSTIGCLFLAHLA